MEEFEVSKRTSGRSQSLYKETPCIRVDKMGKFYIKRLAAAVLEIVDETKEGIVFGYSKTEAFIAFSTDTARYQLGGKGRIDGFRMCAKEEMKKISRIEQVRLVTTTLSYPLVFTIEPNSFKIWNEDKFFLLTPFQQ